MKIFDHLTQIGNAVKFYRATIIIILAACAAMMIYMYIHTEERISEASKTAYVLNADGDVSIATRIRAADFKGIEAIAHVKLFISLFFDVDRFTVEQRIKSAFALGNSSIYALKQKFDQDNWFTNMRQYNISQRVQFSTVQCRSEQPLVIDADFTVTITSDVQRKPQEYQVNIAFTLEETKERTVENPHALSITNIVINNFNLKQ